MTKVGRQEVFFQTLSRTPNSFVDSDHPFSSEGFLEIAPLMMFLQYAFGERCWHSPGYYANLTIDDAWLTEPYGYLSFRGILEQMEKTNFHTTIAFIPWNYDRSVPEVVSLLHNHPDRFSICIHGNNHDHYEFYDYETAIGDPRQAKPLIDQEADIIQAMARMKEHSGLTELPYDPVMVFPQGIAPAKTLGLLKKYNFLATTNAVNIPLRSKAPNDPIFDLRSVSLSFENFASLKRHFPKDRSRFDIAVDLFLGNPLLFFEHHDFFAVGIDAFNEKAEIISDLEPNTRWQGLGYIARHLYLQRTRPDGNYDIRTFSRSIELENMQARSATYFIRKEESFASPIEKLTVNGKAHPYDQRGEDVSFSVTIPANESRLINISYDNDLDLASIEIAKSDPHINRLRRLSAFRDMTLSQYILGRLFTKIYYRYDIYKLGLIKLLVLGLVLGSLSVFCGWYLLRRFVLHNRDLKFMKLLTR
jgi:hypothetical protein